MSKYILGSHNSWSYLQPKRWWMRPFRFMARCQRVDIRKQYEMGVRCFDLRLLFDEWDGMEIAHGRMRYKYTPEQLACDLRWLHMKGDCYVRLIHEVRSRSRHTYYAIESFKDVCKRWGKNYPNIHWWCGRNLYNWEKDYDFGPEPSCEERHASVSKPRLVDDWWPWLYARMHNDAIRMVGTDKEILLIDYVDIK